MEGLADFLPLSSDSMTNPEAYSSLWYDENDQTIPFSPLKTQMGDI